MQYSLIIAQISVESDYLSVLEISNLTLSHYNSDRSGVLAVHG